MNTISKTYVGFPSKSIENYEQFENLESAKNALNYLSTKFVKNGGEIINQTELSIELQDSENTIIFEIC